MKDNSRVPRRANGAPEKIFGTDGIRGAAGEFPLDGVTMERLGFVVTRKAAREGRAPRILLGRDTRESGLSIEDALARGVERAGGILRRAGVLPTPAVAFLVRAEGFDAGVVISASHNPYHENGVKIFSRDGFKLSDSEESDLEKCLKDAALERPFPPLTSAPADALDDENLVERYVKHLTTAVSMPRGHNTAVAVDAAHGAAYRAAPLLFERLGFRVTLLSASPTGRNINEDCGALYPKRVARETAHCGARFGVAFDGDADRAIFAGPSERIFDGDDVLCLLAPRLKREGRLPGSVAVGTVMTNAALEISLKKEGISLRRASVGDRYVLQEMNACGAALGGEPSGHVLALDYATTGDGLLTAALVAERLVKEGKTLEELLGHFTKFPQILLNLNVREKYPLEKLMAVRDAVGRAEAALASCGGRVNVRYSGTEKKVRVMAEGPDDALVRNLTEEIAQAFREEGLLA